MKKQIGVYEVEDFGTSAKVYYRGSLVSNLYRSGGGLSDYIMENQELILPTHLRSFYDGRRSK